MADKASDSYFDGNTFQWIGWQILVFLLALVTLGIAYPWAMCMMERWKIKHTVITGRRLKFTGHGHQLFGRYILWTILTVITFGIYSIWFGLGMKKWVVKHTVYADGGSGVESRFTGGAGGWFCYHLLFWVIAIVTLGIGVPWGREMLLRWEAEHTEIGGSALGFTGTGGQLLVKYLIFILLTPLTIGIYGIFFPVSLLKWQFSHTVRRKGLASTKGAPKGLVAVAVVALALMVVGGVGVFMMLAPSVLIASPELPEPPQTEPANRTELSAGEMEQLLMGEWSNASREDGMIYTLGYDFRAGGEFELGTGAYGNIYLDYFPDMEVDEYGWYSAPMGHPSFYGNYFLTALGDGRFSLEVTGYHDFISDELFQYTSELIYVDDNTILIDGVTYVRGSYTLAECAEIFGFAIEA